MHHTLDNRTVEALLPLVAEWSGFHPDAINAESVRRAVRQFASVSGVEDLVQRAAQKDPEVVAALLSGVAVGETYFFRQVEHFHHVETVALAAWLERGSRTLHAWSAGCATGEEAYSLAACLCACTPAGTTVDVLATDLLETNVQAVERGVYGSWSFRSHSPLLHPVADRMPAKMEKGEAVHVSNTLRAVVRPRVGNLLLPCPDSLVRFDIIFCRNVLAYLTPQAASTALTHLAQALGPGGFLYLGPADAHSPPSGLMEKGNGIWTLPLPVRPATQAPPPVARVSMPPGAISTPTITREEATTKPAPVAMHLEALGLLEKRDLMGAETVLTALVQREPDYLPGLLELALFRARQGKRAAAAHLMREVLARTEHHDPHRAVVGPEEMTVGYLRTSARAYLSGMEGGDT